VLMSTVGRRAIARRAWCVAPRYASARGVPGAGVGTKITGAWPRYAMLREEVLQLAVLLSNSLLVSRDCAEVLLQS
jgi:hypothetical protein